MKYLILFIATIACACTKQSTIDSIIQNQQNILESIYQENLILCENIFNTNPIKYNLLHKNITIIHENYQLLLNCFNNKNFKREEFSLYSDQYFSFIEQLRLDGYQQSKISVQIDFWNKFANKKNNLNNQEKLLLINNLIITNNFIVKSLLENTKNKEYVFTRIYPVVIEDENVIKKGDNYRAKIIMAGMDSTRFPIVKINGHEVMIDEDGQADIEFATSTTGVKKWNGEVIWIKERTGETQVYNINGEFIVK